jgi:capsular exopolysaccharide synthesis family protein
MIETILNNFNIERLLWIVKRKLALMIIFGALGGVIAGAYAIQTSETIYSASASFYVYSNPEYAYDSTVNITSADFSLAKMLVQSYTLVLKSDTVLDKVIEELSLTISPEALAGSIYTNMVEDTSVFYITVYDQDPYKAMEITNALADIAPSEISRIVKSGGIEVIDYAKLPTDPYTTTSLIKFVIIGLIGGFGLSAAIFLFLGLIDTTIRRRYELKDVFTIPILGEIPQMISPSRNVKFDKILHEESPFAIKESYSSLRANILFTGKGEKCPVFAVTSAEENEGKTLNSINIAMALSQLGKKVLIIDGDMRNSSVGKQLHIDQEIGLSHYLAGMTDVANLYEETDNLSVLLAGSIPPNPAELLGGNKLDELLLEMKKKFDFIVIDLPPVGIVADARLIAQKVTGYFLVVRSGVSKINKEKRTVQYLEQVGAEINGFIYNGVNPKSSDYTYKNYSYEYQYGSDKKKKKKKKEK